MKDEILGFLPSLVKGRLLDVTVGGGGHFFEILRARPHWTGECWDRDPGAEQRVAARGQSFEGRYNFRQKTFSLGPEELGALYDFVLADLGISSFQIDDPARGLSFHSEAPLDFRMNPEKGENFRSWLASKSERDLEDILRRFGEEPKAKKLARALKEMDPDAASSARVFSRELLERMKWRERRPGPHPLTRAFQALRIAINDEIGELEALLEWAPRSLAPGGRLAVISFHSLEDRKVKRAFSELEAMRFKVLTSKALTPTPQEILKNPRSRSAKLRVLEALK